MAKPPFCPILMNPSSLFIKKKNRSIKKKNKIEKTLPQQLGTTSLKLRKKKMTRNAIII